MKARAFIMPLLLISLVLGTNKIFSQIPQGFNYQAVVRDGSGNPLANKNISLKITLQSATATPYFTESKTLTTSGQGVINHIVGSGTVSFGTFAGVPWSTGNIYIKVEVDPNGGSSYTQLGDAAKLQSVPFALFANGLQGPAGNDGLSIEWLGELSTVPSSPTVNQAYYNTDDKKAYIFNGTSWDILSQDGVDGTNGTNGINGTNGSSIQWLGSLNDYPATASVNQVFYHNVNKKAYIYNGLTWDIITQDGLTGTQGPKGDPGTGLTNRGTWLNTNSYAPGDYVFDRSSASPSINSMWICQGAVSSTTQPYQDGDHWVEFQAPKGETGATGAQGSPGSNGISVQWYGTSATAPSSPTLNLAYYNSTDKKSYVYDGAIWQILAQDGMPISGTTGQTLYYNGTTWTPNSMLFNNATNVGIGTTSPTQKLDINGSVRLRSTLYDYNNSTGTTNQLLTRGASGLLWQSPSAISVPSGSGTSGQLALWSGTNSLQGISNLAWGTTSLQVTSPTTAGTDDPILEVKNKDGKVVFGVYQGGVRIYVEDSPITKGAKGGFAIGGLTNQAKSGPAEYMRITSDSARIYINESTTKGAKGGFAIGGLTNQAKTVVARNLMYVAPDSTRIYVNESVTKGAKGGFAIGGLTNQAKSSTDNFLQLTPDNYFIGQNAGAHTTGLYNSFVGYESGSKNIIGANNVFLGYQSGYNNNASYNTFIGFQAGLNYTTGNYNTFIGYQAGLASATLKGTGKNNVALGYLAGMSLTTGANNVFIGTEAGRFTTGAIIDTVKGENTFVGKWAGRENTTGYQNIALGYYAGKGLTTNNRNTLVGNNAGEVLSTGNANVYLGTYAGREATTGYNNTILGYDAGYQNRTGRCNTFVGFQAGRGWGAVVMGDSSVFIGHEAGANEGTSHKLYISNSITSTPLIWGDFKLQYATIHGKLGINTKIPTHQVDVRGQMRITESSSYDVWIQGGSSTSGSSRNLAVVGDVPGDKLYLNYGSEYTNGTIIGGNVGIGTISPSQKLHIKGTTPTNSQILLEAGEWNSIGDYTQITLGDGNHYIRGEYANGLTFYTPDERGFLFGGGGNVRIGTTLNYAPLNVEKWEGLVAMFNRRNTAGQVIQFRYTDTEVGSISTNGTSTTYNTTSDRRMKENIVDSKFGLQNLMNIKVRDFAFKNDPSKKLVTGFIAQELYEIFPDAVTKPTTEDGIWQVDYGRITPLLVKAIQDQDLKIKQLEEKVKEFENLKVELEAIKAMLKK